MRREERRGEEERGATHEVQSSFDFSSVFNFAGLPPTPTPMAAAMPASPPPPFPAPVLRRFAAGNGAAAAAATGDSAAGFGGFDPDVVGVDDPGPKRASRDAVVGSVGFVAVEGAGAEGGGGGTEVVAEEEEEAVFAGGWRAK